MVGTGNKSPIAILHEFFGGYNLRIIICIYMFDVCVLLEAKECVVAMLR